MSRTFIQSRAGTVATLSVLMFCALICVFGMFVTPMSGLLFSEPFSSLVALLALTLSGFAATRVIPWDGVALVLLFAGIGQEIAHGARWRFAPRYRLWVWIAAFAVVVVIGQRTLVPMDDIMRAAGAKDRYALAFTVSYGAVYVIAVLAVMSLFQPKPRPGEEAAQTV
ncbi:hypothetical protein [Brevundimonas sp. GCM10030266]|uniref:hypothetical protein n=1 Tax=Brevundimonas sp. GCM10030266 TaxID=3273386 RepID=UPI0036143FCB